MTIKILAMLFVIGSLIAAAANTPAADLDTPRQDVRLSPDLFNLLREEMREIAAGTQGIALFLATADWKSIQETSTKIRASYIMEKKLTSAQLKELEQALPSHFKQLDSEFHQRAEKLGMAAAAHDLELTAFQFSRLVESCALCHASYAKSRFPGFVSPVQHEHHH